MLFEHATNKKSIENAERLESKVLRGEYMYTTLTLKLQQFPDIDRGSLT